MRCLNKVGTYFLIRLASLNSLNLFHRHLHNTAHIGDFVIASEDAIAKGIRRIVALTGPEATKAIRTAALLQKRIFELQKMIVMSEIISKEYVRKIVELTEELSHALIPAWLKAIIFNKTLISADKLLLEVTCLFT